MPFADDFRTTDLAPTPCPACGDRLERSSGTASPRAGDLTLCGHCRTYLVFTLDLGLRRLSDEEWRALPADRRQTFAQVRAALPIPINRRR